MLVSVTSVPVRALRQVVDNNVEFSLILVHEVGEHSCHHLFSGCRVGRGTFHWEVTKFGCNLLHHFGTAPL